MDLQNPAAAHFYFAAAKLVAAAKSGSFKTSGSCKIRQLQNFRQLQNLAAAKSRSCKVRGPQELDNCWNRHYWP